MGAEYRRPSFGASLAKRPQLLDGATGTELERRGVAAGLPLWSTRGLLDAPETVLAIHRDYVAAGADAITANTFRTQARVLASVGRAEDDRALTDLAVSLARDAAGAERFVLGSAPTLEDCYLPERVPEDDALRREHARHADALAAAGVDAILVETMNTIREAHAAAKAAADTGLPFLASFVCRDDGALLSGEALADAVAAVAPLAPAALLVNCVSPETAARSLPTLAAAGIPFGAYPNCGVPDASGGFECRPDACPPDRFAVELERWVAAGARIVGGCCGTTPAHIEAAARALAAFGG